MKRRTPFIEQMSQTECGIACIAMVAAYHKKHIPLHELREYVGNSRDGNTLYDLYQVSKELGFEAKCFTSDENSLGYFQLPAILYWESKHFVVLEKVKNDTFYILDPSQGRRKVKREEFELSFSKYILQMTPGEGFQKRKPLPLWKPYIKMVLNKPKVLISLFLITLFMQLFVLVSPILTQRMIDDILLANQSNLLSVFLQGILISFVTYCIFSLLRNEISIKMTKYLDYELSFQYFSHLLKVPYNFFQTRQSGDLLYRFSNLRAIRSMLSNQIMKTVLDALLIIVILVYMIVKSPFMTAVLVGLTFVLYLFILSLRPVINEVNRKELTEDTNLYSYQTESIMGMLDIKASGAEDKVSSRWLSLYGNFAKAFVKKERTLGFMTSLSGGLTFFIPLLIVWVGTIKVSDGTISLGELVAFQGISTYFISTSSSLIMSIESFFQLKVYLRRIKDVTDTPPEFNEEISYDNHDLQGDIKLDHVSFSYSEFSTNILSDIDLEIKQGEKIAIIGPSGSGKSTLSKILMGLHQPTEGAIYYDGKSLHNLDKPYLRNQMGIVTQEPFLFNQSILNNIKLNNENVSNEDIVRASEIAQIHQEIMEMPMGYNTIVSETGQNLSGGQRQRLSIARALVNKPKVIIFDEATNALDSIKEKEIEKYLTQMRCTRIVIAHRLSSIIDADQIIVLNKGEVVDKGNHNELFAANSYYRSLFSTSESLDLKGGEQQHDERSEVYEKSIP